MPADILHEGLKMQPEGELMDMPGISSIFIIAGEKCYSPETMAEKIASKCRALGAEAIVIDFPDNILIAAGDCYEDRYIVAQCCPGVNAASASRILQLRLLEKRLPDCVNRLLPADQVRMILALWERKITLIFGHRYASKLVSGSLGRDGPGSMASEDMEAIRRNLLIRTGYCVNLQKVDK